MGQRALRESGEVQAIPFFQQAIQFDPDFALAYTTLGRAREDLGDDQEAVEDFTKAYDLRDRLSERERYYITTLYNETVTGDMERARQAGELWIRAYPRDGVAREKLGTVYGDLGEWENANAQTQEALRLDPESIINISNSVTTTAALNHLDEAQLILETAQARGLDGPVIHETIYPLAFLRGDHAEIERQVAWAAAQGDTEYVLLSEHSDTEAYYGRLCKARDFSQRAIESATRQEAKEAAALFEIITALREMETGNVSLASTGVQAALSLAPSRDVKILAALVLARSGDVTRAKALTRELEDKNPFSTLIRFYWLPTLKASLEVRAGKPQNALSLLRVAAPYELSQTSVSSARCTLPTSVAKHTSWSTMAAGRLQNSRNCLTIGASCGARKQYSDFLSLWKEADPDIPLLTQALAEYAKL